MGSVEILAVRDHKSTWSLFLEVFVLMLLPIHHCCVGDFWLFISQIAVKFVVKGVS